MSTENSGQAQALAREITNSEILRIRIILGIFTFGFAGTFLFYLIAHDQYMAIFQGRLNVVLLPVFFGSVAAVYAATLFFITRLARKSRNLPAAGRFFNAAIEGVIPTAALWVLSPPGDLAAALTMPPLFAYSFFVVLSVIRLNPAICITTGVTAAASYLAFSLHMINSAPAPTSSLLFAPQTHIAKALFIFISATIAAFVASQLRQRVLNVLDSMRKKQELETLFGEHVSQEVVQKLLSTRNNNLAEIRHISALFLDIRNFTSFSESRTAHEVYTELNKLLAFMIEIVHAHSGIINKFLGDGFLAVFGAPLDDSSHATNAVRAARAISSELRARTSSGSVVNLGIGIGIHCGEALTGNVGSDKRKEYTVIGDVINLASRIEQLNKQFQSEILISDEVRQAVGEAFAMQEKGEVLVKGREKPVRVYAV